MQKNVIWTKIQGLRIGKGLLTSQLSSGWTIIVVFKKPIAFKYVHYDEHGADLPKPDEFGESHYVVIELSWIFYNGLLDISFTNEPGK
jgi:hypothetical protein